MSKYHCVVLPVLIINLVNYLVLGQNTIRDYNNDEQDFQKYYGDAFVALTNTILSEFHKLNARMERLENNVERQDTYARDSFQENKRQMEMTVKNEIQVLYQKLSSGHCPDGFNYSVAGFPKCYAVLNDRVNWSTAQQKCSQLNNNAHLAIREISPKDTVELVGSRTTLKCRRSSQLVEWTHAAGFNATSKVIVNRCEVVDEYTDLYAVDRSDLSCNLIINNITMNNAGLYTCRDQLSTETPSTAEVLVCPEGFQPSNGSNTCYHTIFKAVNWTTAGQLCNALVTGSYLVMINSTEENIAIATYLKERITDNASNICGDASNSKYFWTSGQRQTNCKSPFEWKPNFKTFPFTYTHWAVNQPDCSGSLDFCVHIWPNSGYMWNDIGCNKNMCVLCEYGPY